MTDAWIRTYTGGRAYFFEPEKSEIVIEDISHALSLLCRFNGATREMYSVAQHSCLVAETLYERAGDIRLSYCGLMHDAAEAFISDIPSPFKKHFPEFIEVEKRFEAWLGEKFDFELTDPLIKEHDLRALATEMRDLMRVSDHKVIQYPPFSQRIYALSPNEAEELFLKTYHSLKP